MRDEPSTQSLTEQYVCAAMLAYVEEVRQSAVNHCVSDTYLDRPAFKHYDKVVVTVRRLQRVAAGADGHERLDTLVARQALNDLRQS